MKKSVLGFYVLLSLLAFSCSSEIKDSIKEERNIETCDMTYGVSSARIVYQIKNGPQCGTKTIVFQDSGLVKSQILELSICEELKETIKSSGMNERMIERLDNFVQRSDRNGDTIYSVRDGVIFSQSLFQGVGSQAELDSLFTKIGVEEILGRKCTVVESFGVWKIWYWKGLILKREALKNELQSEIVVEIDLGYVPKESDFIWNK